MPSAQDSRQPAPESRVPEDPAPRLPRRDATPRRQLRRFAWLSAVSAVTILVLVGAGLFLILRQHLIDEAERNSVAVAEAVFAHERAQLLDQLPDGSLTVHIDPQQIVDLDMRMRTFLRSFSIVKIKVYDTARTIVYSTDATIIGKKDDGNRRLQRVLRDGATDAELVRKDSIPDLQHQEKFDVDVVETYTPIRAGTRIVGSFEVYIDVTPAYARMWRVVGSAMLVLLLVLAVVFGALFYLMRQGMERLAVVQSRLRDFATIDVLTRLWNRRQLYARIDEEFARLARSDGHGGEVNIGFVMADIDRFKQINDAHGHLVGDRVLREVARRLKIALRPYDVIGRFGGEEFLAMLPRTKLSDAQVVAERMRQLIAGAPIDGGGGTQLDVTASFGVTASSGPGDDVNAAVDRADRALYRAKQGGRNRVESSEPAPGGTG